MNSHNIKFFFTLSGIPSLIFTVFIITLPSVALTALPQQGIQEQNEIEDDYQGAIYEESELLQNGRNKAKKTEEEDGFGYNGSANWGWDTEDSKSSGIIEVINLAFPYDSSGAGINQIQDGGNRTTETPPPPPDAPDLEINQHLLFLCAAGLALAVLRLKKTS